MKEKQINRTFNRKWTMTLPNDSDMEILKKEDRTCGTYEDTRRNPYIPSLVFLTNPYSILFPDPTRNTCF